MSVAVEARSRALDLFLNTSHVVGQERARRQLAVLLERQAMVAEGLLDYSNGAIVGGRTGSGKTMLVKAMASMCGLPFVEVNATQYTDKGYVGLDLSQMFLPLIEAAARMYDEKREREPYHVQKVRKEPSVLQRPQKELNEIVKMAEHGVVLLDEFDKWMLQEQDSSGRNVGRKLQAELLKMVEGGREYVSDSEEELGVSFDTTRVLIICTGAFVGLVNQVAQRLDKEPGPDFELSENFYLQIEPIDFEKYGLLPELAGRLSTHIFIRPLQEEHLVQIARATGVVDEYKQRFATLGVVWDVPDTAEVYIARRALERKTGARALQYTLWQVFADALFDASARQGEVSVVRYEMGAPKAWVE